MLIDEIFRLQLWGSKSFRLQSNRKTLLVREKRKGREEKIFIFKTLRLLRYLRIYFFFFSVPLWWTF